MGIIQLGKQIRLNGSDASAYCTYTGRIKLPSTVSEYNRALREAASVWRDVNCPEGDLLAYLCENSILSKD